ncbi:MAG TPA: flagellar export protein FliJ [Rubrivivax sp.]|nr:flagellar export protein FliJ [Rubrivivax sp.]
MQIQGFEALQLLQQREQQQCDAAQAALRQCSDAARRAREQQLQLLGYRGDYEARWSAQFVQGSTIDILHCYRSFMQRLDQAVAMQARQAEAAERQLAQARQALLACERRLASVRKLIERRHAELQRAGRRREQKHSDEQAQRMRFNRTQHDQLLPH